MTEHNMVNWAEHTSRNCWSASTPKNFKNSRITRGFVGDDPPGPVFLFHATSQASQVSNLHPTPFRDCPTSVRAIEKEELFPKQVFERTLPNFKLDWTSFAKSLFL